MLRTLLLLLWVQVSIASSEYNCPMGFNLTHIRNFSKSEPTCYKKKGPETFYDKFTNCTGNLFNMYWYYSANIVKPVETVWNDFKSLFSGGPFVHWVYESSMGNIEDRLVILNYEKMIPFAELDGELCVLSNETSARCTDKHYSYCVLEPFKRNDIVARDGCEDLKDFNYSRFWSPIPICLTLVTPESGVTWYQAHKLCTERKGQLLNTGWMYASSPLFHNTSRSSTGFPLGTMNVSKNKVSTYKFTIY